MDYNKNLKSNVDILQRRLDGLKKGIGFIPISEAKYKFLMVYFDVISEYTDKSFDILNEDKFREALLELED